MRLIYWHAAAKNQDELVDIVEPTKKQAEAEIAAFGAENYEQPVKKVLVYGGAFDLFQKAVSKGAGAGYV